jgi:CPA1 family monovalent cation:H+ antiporter
MAIVVGKGELILICLVAVALLTLVARKIRVPYPILLTCGGVLLALVPGLPAIQLEPQLVFNLFLPPLLYPAAVFTSWRDFRANLRAISLLAVGLVLFTTVAVALIAHYFMGLPLAVGFVLGAIISPPDAIAATAIAQRLKVPQRIVTILEGESLVNDATALVAYRFAVVAVATGSFSLAKAGGQFLIVAIGGILLGLFVGWLAELFHRRVEDAPIETTVSLLTPFAAYLPAEHLGVSGVLSVVTVGLYLGWRLPEITDFRTRLEARPVWQMVGFLLNGFVFVLIGLQLPAVLHGLSDEAIPIRRLIWYSVVISVAVIGVRILWVFPATYLPRILSKKIRERDPSPSWRHVMIVAWTGMRGVVSLAAAMALTDSFPKRDLILFLTFVVILATLVLQGLSLPPLIRWLGIEDDGNSEREERDARLKANEAALAKLNETARSDPTKADALQRLRVEYEDHILQLKASAPGHAGKKVRLFSKEYERLSQDALEQERKTILELRNAGAISDEVQRDIQRDIDLAEARLKHHQ